MKRLHPGLLLGTVVCLAPASTALAGENPFVVGVTARAIASISGPPVVQDSQQDFVADTSGLPAMTSASVQDATAITSGTFKEFSLWAEHTSSANAGTDFADSRVTANDTVTLAAPGAPAGTTRLEITWHLEGLLTGESSMIFGSFYRPDTSGTGDTTTIADQIFITNPGPINQDITYVYDNIPIGSPWNIRTFGVAVGQRLGVADFDDTMSLTNVQLFVDNVPIHAGLTGVSGTVYSVLGDLDGDGFVGIIDLNLVLSAWNQSVLPGDPGDPNGDGFVGIDDLNIVLGNWNTGTPPVGAAVPEPTSLALLGAGLVMMTKRKRTAR